MADAPIDALLPRTEDLAKGWLLALLEDAPLGDAPGILAADLARDGPRICDAVLRAIADDTDLRRLEPGGALERLVSRVGELAGANSLDAALRAVDALQAVIWSALCDELRAPDTDQVAAIAERLALVTELVRGATLRRQWGDGTTSGAPGASGATPFGVVRTPPPGPVGGAGPAPAAVQAPGDAGPAGVAGPPGVAGAPEAAAAPPDTAAAASAPEAPAGGSVDAPPAPAAPAQQTSLREQPSGASALWVGALAEEIQRAGHSGTPLSLLLAELEDADRVVAVEVWADASVTFGRFAQAVRSVARRQDILVSETETRAWVIARDTARAGAQALGSRIAAAVREGPSWRGAPMMASVGVSVLGEDGSSAGEMIEAAEEARFGAAANGIGVIRAMPDESPSGPPSGLGPSPADN